MDGKEVKTWTAERHYEGANEATIDLTELPAGIYFLKIDTEKQSTTQKIVKH